MLSYSEQQKALNTAIDAFPGTFGLRAYPGKVFRVSAAASYYSSTYGVLLYTEIQDGSEWLSFAKGSPEELRGQIVKL